MTSDDENPLMSFPSKAAEEEERAKLPRQNIYESGMNVGTGEWGPTPQKYVKREDYAEVERSNVILEKNVRDLQKQLNQAHKRIATLVERRSKMALSRMCLTGKEIRECLLEDMEMLRDGRWVPDDDSIDVHKEYVEELYRRSKGGGG